MEFFFFFSPLPHILLELSFYPKPSGLTNCSKFPEINLQTKSNIDIGIALVSLDLHGFYRSIFNR